MVPFTRNFVECTRFRVTRAYSVLKIEPFVTGDRRGGGHRKTALIKERGVHSLTRSTNMRKKKKEKKIRGNFYLFLSFFIIIFIFLKLQIYDFGSPTNLFELVTSFPVVFFICNVPFPCFHYVITIPSSHNSQNVGRKPRGEGGNF